MIFLSKNLKILRERCGYTQKELADKLGVKANTISNYEKGVSSPDFELLEIITDLLNAKADDILFRDMADMNYQKSRTLINSCDNLSDYTSIPVVDISVAAGCGGCDNTDYMEVTDSIRMPPSMVKANARYFCVRVKGESMTPTILYSSYVVVRLLERPEWEYMPENHVYVVSDREGRAYIKRVKNRLREHGFIVCMSDNVDKANYPNFNLQENEINSILHAEWYISAKMPNINDTYYKKVNDLEDDMDMLKGQMKQVLNLLSNK